MTKKDKIKVLLFCGSLNIGGTERNAVNIAKQLDKSVFEVEMFCLFNGGPLESELKKNAITYSFGHFGRIFDFRVYWRSFKACTRNDFDVIHCFGYPSIYFGVFFGFLSGIPKIIVAIQALDSWKSKNHILLDMLIKPFVNLYIADSAGAGTFAMNQQRINAAKMTTIYDGVDTAALIPIKNIQQLRKELGITDSHPIVGIVARLQDEHKGQSFFIKAIPNIITAFPNTHFLIVGDGNDRRYLEDIVGQLGVNDKVIFAGFRTDLADILSIIDILVIPSIQWESITKTMVEAMALARPIVATSVGDISEILDNGTTGILIPPQNSDEIANAVNYLLGNPDFAMKIGHEGRNKIDRLGLTLENSTKKLEYYYSQSNHFHNSLKTIYFFIIFPLTVTYYFCFKLFEGILLRLRRHILGR